MPIPKPKHIETKEKFISRCVRFLNSEGMQQKQSSAICFDQWNKRLINQVDLTSDPDLEPTKFNDKNLFDQVYSGDINPVFLAASLYSFHYLNIMSGVGLGFGLPSDFITDSPKYKAAANYKKNIESFSGVKTFNQTLDLSKAVFDINGIKRPFREFKELALGINTDYNINWLRSEQNAAFRVAQSAESWSIIQDDKETLPMLQYVTVGDSRVRPEHAAWDGVI